MDFDAARDHVAHALRALETALDGLVDALAHSSASVQLESATDREKLARSGECHQ